MAGLHPTSNPFGTYKRVPGAHYDAFFPSNIPRAFDLSRSAVSRLANAEAALGRLAGAGRLLSNPHLLVRPYLIREALASTKIEGTQASLVEVLEVEGGGGRSNDDIEEVVNYIDALERASERRVALPLSVRLMKELHAKLLSGVRGRDRQPGHIRTTQNWIGSPGSPIEGAAFVPPPPSEITRLLSDWERFAHTHADMPVLVQSALLHYQFETIHPFLDGNGRLGRLLIIVHLLENDRLPRPLLYLSPFFERQRSAYYAHLQHVRDAGDADPWICFFLEGIEVQATAALRRVDHLTDLHHRYRERTMHATRSKAVALVDLVMAFPILTSTVVESKLDVSRPSAIRLLRQLVDVGILEETPTGIRNQSRFVAQELISMLTDDQPSETRDHNQGDRGGHYT